MVEKIELSRITKVLELVSTPPRHGKTETLLHSIAWTLRENPSLTCAYITHSGQLAQSKSRRARRFALEAGVVLAPGSKAVQEWRTTSGGGLLATSVGGSLTGHGVNFMIVDDPFKDREQAESELVREKVFEWFNGVAFTRLEPGGSCVVNMARWHEDDLIGRLQHSELPWHTTTLAALGGPNEDQPLWPQRFSLEALSDIKKQLGDYQWQSLYMGSPTNRAGFIFKRRWFEDNIVDIAPTEFDYKIISVDGAWMTGVGHDPSCLQVWGVNKRVRTITLLECHVMRLEFPDLLNFVMSKGVEHLPAPICIENSSAGIAVYQTLRRETMLPVVAVNVHQAKTTRAEQIAPLIDSGRAKFPRRLEGLGSFIDEHCAFPNGNHDDRVDATSIALSRFVQVERDANVDVWFDHSSLVSTSHVPNIYRR
jgi:predicted phage terminase large subunit-like protein